ncbi:hypothetical protein K501DRAFT_323565 [Backusella circina FSU 941]|nr:hypothetical protein K501DRAFT_323565 [Backusella circina FSU 941]
MTRSLVCYSSRTRSFCPLIIYHDNPEELSNDINQHDSRSAITRHKERTNEMMEHNVHFWAPSMEDNTAELGEKDIYVSPSTSTTSNISCSSSSSAESVATIDNAMYSGQPKTIMMPPYASMSPELSTSSDYYYPKPLYMNQQPIKKNTPNASVVDPTTKKRRRGNLPKEVTEFLRRWLIQHKKHPYPAEKEKIDLARHTGLTVNQISNWFINARRRILQPMLESENLAHAQMMGYHHDYHDRRLRRDSFGYYQHNDYMDTQFGHALDDRYHLSMRQS